MSRQTSPIHSQFALFLLAFLTSGFLAACERAETPGSSADTTVVPTVVPDAVVEREPSDTVRVSLTEWKIAVARDTIDAGRIVFVADNQGEYVHGLEVERGEDEKKTSDIQPGATGSVEMDMTKGTYELYCPIEDSHGKHEELGMKTTIVVR